MNHINLIKTTRVLLLILITIVIGLRGGSLLGINIPFEPKQEVSITEFKPQDVKSLFPVYTRIEQVKQSVYKVYEGEKFIGTLLNSSPKADSIVGYVNSTPLLVGLNTQNTIIGIQLLPNRESPDFIKKIVNSGMLERWKGTNIVNLSALNVDGVSGATYSSQAIIKSIRFTVNEYGLLKTSTEKSIEIVDIVKWSSAVIMLIASLLMFFIPVHLNKFRNIILLFNLLVLGFWVGDTLSVNSIFNWIISGFQMSVRWFVTWVFIISIVIPLLTKRAFYCSCLCPYGSAQELVHKMNRRYKIELPFRIRRKLPLLREFIFGIIVLLLCVGITFDLTNIEPFSVFLLETASIPVIILAILFLLISFFISRPWCRFLCPTGQFLEIIRKLFIVK